MGTSFNVALHPEGVDRNLNIAHGLEYDLVALHPEGVDRNLGCRPVAKAGEVALHPEGVDRNREISVAAVAACIRSPSTRRAWIEIHRGRSKGIAGSVALPPEGVDRKR